MLPRAAKIRQQQASVRRARLEENADRAVREDMFARHNTMRGVKAADRFATTNRFTRRDPNRGVITTAEWNAIVEEHEDSGSKFRNVFFMFVLFAIILLAWVKYDVEFNLEPPQIESGKGFGEVNSNSAGARDDWSGVTPSELERYYETLGVKGRFRPEGAHFQSPSDDADKERRRENFRIRKEIKKAYMEHQKQRGQLVHCGRSCETKNKQVELAYTRLASQVDRELYSVLLDTKDTKSKRAADASELKKAYEAKKAQLEATEESGEDREMALEELKDAYDILVNPDAKNYYLLYGMKPPEHMRHMSARHGGWGQELALGTFKYRIIFAWLEFFHDYIGLWGETVVLGCVLLFILSRIPLAIKQSTRLLDDLEWEEAGENDASGEKEA